MRDCVCVCVSDCVCVRVQPWVLTLATDNKCKPDEMSSLSLGAKESMDNRYDGFPEERVWYAIVQSLICDIEQWVNDEISEVRHNGKTEDTVWQTYLSSSEDTVLVLEYP